MKLLLTSTGFSKKAISDTFIGLLNKPLNEVNLVFIPTASRFKEELKYVAESRQELVGLGIKKIITFNLDRTVAENDLKDVDVVYVCGGNTFYLLKKIRESGFDKALKNFDGLYVGVSAGSIVVGPDIEVSGPWDENNVNLTDTTGMRIVDFAVIPHFQRKEQAIVQDLKDKADYEILELTDNQAVLVKKGARKIIE